MKTGIVKGLTVLGIGAMICGVMAAKPASADEIGGRIDIKLGSNVHVDLAIGRPVIAPCAPVVVRRDRDWRWDRDHDARWRDHDRR